MVAHIPYRLQMALGRGLGMLALEVMPHRRRIAETNIRLCFPNVNQKERTLLLRQNFKEMGISLIELGLACWGSEVSQQRRTQIMGEDYVQAALKKGKGVILLGAHFVTIEMVAQLTGKRHRIWGIYRPQKNKLFDRFLFRVRSRSLAGLLHRDNMIGIVRCLKQNQIIYYAGDQDYGRQHSQFAPFFGIQAATITAGLRLAKVSGAAIIPMFHYRLPNNEGYQVILQPALENIPSDDVISDLTRINQIIEAGIAVCPTQYLWIHRRFKTRPSGIAGYY